MNPYTGKKTLAATDDLGNDGFWPDLNAGTFAEQYRIPSEYKDPVFIDRLTLAIIDINAQLQAVKALLINDYLSLPHYCAVNVEQIAGVDVLIKKYEEAVFSKAKALLLKQFLTMERKAEAENLAKEAPETESYWLERSALAVQFFLTRFLTDADTGQAPLSAGSMKATVI